MASARKQPSRIREAATPRDRKPRPRGFMLHIISDSTGSLASHLINTILTQFPGVQFHKEYHPFSDTAEKIDAVVRSLGRKRKDQLVLHALVHPEQKLAVRNACVRIGIPHFDLTGSLVQFISDHIGVLPDDELSRLHQVDSGYFLRIDAMEFTAQHDDGRNLDSIQESDVVLVGLSRVSKSPTATYLGSLGHKVANVSLAPETGIPRELDRRAVKKKVVALTSTPKALYRARYSRWNDEQIRQLRYATLQDVIREIVWAESEYRKRGWPILDITGMTIEKAAATVLETQGISRKF
ncbi:MAG: kinase/pyrophosphorylase [Phycisphaeraceae bacterium]|nr:kinase/pyrophosphorylase [Phycisphaeraceae bacterium]